MFLITLIKWKSHGRRWIFFREKGREKFNVLAPPCNIAVKPIWYSDRIDPRWHHLENEYQRKITVVAVVVVNVVEDGNIGYGVAHAVFVDLMVM